MFHYESDRDRQQLEADLAEERVLNNILLKGDRTVDIANAPAGGASLPQRELLNLAESQCHKLILGQTLTSDTSRNGGSLAQARVHAGVQADIVKKRAEYVADVLNSQLIPSIVLLNYGTLDVPMPELRFKIPQEGVTLERVQVAKTALEIKGMKLKKSEVYEFIGFAQPAEGDEVFESVADEPKDGFSALFGKGKSGNDTDPDDDPPPPKKKAPAKPEDAAEPVSAVKSPAPTDPAQEWLAPIKEKFLEARRNGADMADLKKMLLTMHPNTKALAKAFANNILAGFAGESEEVDAAKPTGCNQYKHQPECDENGDTNIDKTKYYTEDSNRHDKEGESNKALPNLPTSMELVSTVPELENYGVPGGRVYIRRKLKGKFPIKGRMKNKKKAIGRFKKVLTPPYSVSRTYQEIDAKGNTHNRIDIIKTENGVTSQLVIQTSGGYAGGIVTYIDDISKPRMQKRTAGASTIR